MEDRESKPKRRPRVSLLSLFLLTALVATSVTVVMLWREVGPLRAEVRRLRSETGQLTVIDPKKIYAVPIRTMEEDTWKWRIYLPKGHAYRVAENIHLIKGRTWQKSKSEWMRDHGASCSQTIEPGEFVLTVKLEQDPTHSNGKGHWNIRSSARRLHGAKSVFSTNAGGICGTVIEWLNDRRARGFATGDALIDGQQVELDASEGIELLTIRRSQVTELPTGWSTTPADSTQDSEGIGVWIVAQ